MGDQALEACRTAEGRDTDGNYGERGLTPAMRRIEAKLEHGHLVGDTERFALKSPDRFREKLAELIKAEPDKPAEEHAREIHDGVRYTFLFSPEQYVTGLQETTAQLESQGFELGVRKNTWGHDEYKGVNTRWRDHDSGITFEIQFHTKESWTAKQTTHSAYEKINNPRTSASEREHLRGYQREVSARVIAPTGWELILDYRKEGW